MVFHLARMLIHVLHWLFLLEFPFDCIRRHIVGGGGIPRLEVIDHAFIQGFDVFRYTAGPVQRLDAAAGYIRYNTPLSASLPSQHSTTDRKKGLTALIPTLRRREQCQIPLLMGPTRPFVFGFALGFETRYVAGFERGHHAVEPAGLELDAAWSW